MLHSVSIPESSVEMFVVKLRRSESNHHRVRLTTAALDAGEILHGRVFKHKMGSQTLSIDESPRCSETGEDLVRRDVESYVPQPREESGLRFLRCVCHEANMDVCLAQPAEMRKVGVT